MYKKYYLMDYLPAGFSASEEQKKERQICYDFNNGILREGVKIQFLEKIKQIIGADKEFWLVCFIPAFSAAKTKRRFGSLASVIREEGYNVSTDAIYNKYDRRPTHIIGRTKNPTESFGIKQEEVAQKKILLIDDIITRGETFSRMGKALEDMGATTIVGLFLAQTINPEFAPHSDSVNLTGDEDVLYLLDLLEEVNSDRVNRSSYDYYEEETYYQYRGSYAQDVAGWSDQDIDDVFEGDPDAYWNID